MLSHELFLKDELNKKIGLKTSKKGPGAPVIDTSLETGLSIWQPFSARFAE
jgi:hypothetical protein